MIILSYCMIIGLYRAIAVRFQLVTSFSIIRVVDYFDVCTDGF